MKGLLMTALLSVLCTSAFAQELVVYNGGIGSDEREAVTATGTRLVFFQEGGAFVARVEVQIQDQNGREVLNTTSLGPWLILKLPRGRYQVQASLDPTNTRSGYIEVDAGNEEYAFMFRPE